MILGLLEWEKSALPTSKFIDRKTGLNRFKPIFPRGWQDQKKRPGVEFFFKGNFGWTN